MTSCLRAQINDRRGRSCAWKRRWGQCDEFHAQCAKSCNRCVAGAAAAAPSAAARKQSADVAPKRGSAKLLPTPPSKPSSELKRTAKEQSRGVVASSMLPGKRNGGREHHATQRPGQPFPSRGQGLSSKKARLGDSTSFNDGRVAAGFIAEGEGARDPVMLKALANSLG